jgi:mannosyl-oligosaccharide glucosidase
MVQISGTNALLATTLTVLAAAQDSVFSKASNDSLLWGPYRPNLYFGLRPRVPNSILTGLLWGRVEDYNSIQNDARFTCEQHAGMAGYGWDIYDPRTGGVQVVHDKDNGIDLETSFVKFDHGSGGWAARVKGTPREDAERREASAGGPDTLMTAVWFTVSAEGLGTIVPRDIEDSKERGYEGDVVLEGEAGQLGEFRITITEPKGQSHPSHNHPSYQSKPLDHTFVHSVQVPEEALWQSKGE